jgi:acyl-CoA reductase-like NAD-dependent aldehyde dehydrogenase
VTDHDVTTMTRVGRYDRLFIGGEWVESASTERIEVISPVTEEPIAPVPAGSPADVDRAVAAARAAFDGGWGRARWRIASTSSTACASAWPGR